MVGSGDDLDEGDLSDELVEEDDDPTAPTEGALLMLAESRRGAHLRDANGNTYEIKVGVTCIGRSPYRKVNLEDTEVSRKHAEVVRQGTQFFVRDMSSPNGTHVNGFRIHGDVPLQDGDQIQIGHTTLVFERGDPE